MQPVRQTDVRAHAWRWRHERRDGQEDVGEEEEEDDGPRGAEGRSPVEACALGIRGIEEEEAGGDEGVDNCQRIGNHCVFIDAHQYEGIENDSERRTIQDEVESITRRRCEDDDD